MASAEPQSDADAPKDVSKVDMARAFALGFLPALLSNFITPFLTSVLVTDRGLSSASATAIVGSTTLIGSVLTLVSGQLVDRIDGYRSSRAGLALMACLPLALCLPGPTAGIFIAILLHRFGSNLFDHSAASLIYSRFAPSQARVLYSYYYGALNCGTFLSPLAVFAAGFGGYRSALAGALVLHGFVCIWYHLSFRQRGRRDTEGRAAMSWRALKVWPLPAIFGFGLCYSLTYTQYFTTLPLTMGQVTWMDRPLYPLLVSLNGVLVVAFQQLYVPMARRWSPASGVLGGSALLLASYALLAAGGSHVGALLAFAVLFSAAEVFINLNITDCIFRVAPEGQKTSWLSIFQASRLSGGVGISLGGSLLAAGGPAAWTAYLLIATVPMVLVATAILRREAASLRASSGPFPTQEI